MANGRRESEGCIAEKDYLYLIAYLEEFDAIPKELYAVFEECDLPMAATLTFSQFMDWVRKYPAIMDVSIVALLYSSMSCRHDRLSTDASLLCAWLQFLAQHLPPSPMPVSPLLLRTSEEFLNPVYVLKRLF